TWRRAFRAVLTATPTGSCSCRERSGPSPGWRETRRRSIEGNTAWSWLASGPRGVPRNGRAVEQVLKMSNQDYGIQDFSPYGYDERQYCSPGINLPVGCLMRTPHGQFPEYHTSADNPDLVRLDALADSLRKCLSIADVLDGNGRYVNQQPKCEPQLGRRGLYSMMGGGTDSRTAH